MPTGLPPRTTAEWVQAALEAERALRNRPRVMVDNPFKGELRAKVKQKFVSGYGGKTHVAQAGERVIYGPTGERIRIIETTTGGNLIEHGDHQHAAIRPRSAAVITRAQ